MLVEYIIKQLLHNVLHRQPLSKTKFWKGYIMYRTTSSKEKDNVKSLFLVIKELCVLSKYWQCFPDSYFRMGMFMKEWNDIAQMKSFVPQDAYYRYSLDRDSRYHILIDDKILFHDLLSQYGLPVPNRYFIFRSNIFRANNKILSDQEVDEIISKVSENRIFVKKFTGGAASGISVFLKNSLGKFIDSEQDVVSASMIRRKYKNQDYIFEQEITQEKTLAKFNPDTVNTIRVLTYKKEVIAAAVRFGGKGEIVDNVSVHGVACSLDTKTGELSEYGLRMYNTEKFYKHPDSGVEFKGTTITQWPEVKKLVEKTLLYLPYYNSIGFDIAITNNGPVILEINTGAGINLTQMGKKIGLEKFFQHEKNH